MEHTIIMMSRVLALAVFVFAATICVAEGAAVDEKSRSQITEDLIEWVRSEGGFFSSKLEIRRMDPQDETSYFGVFAKEDIEEDETLIEVPKKCYISLEDDEIQSTAEYEKSGGEDMETIMSIYFGNTCRLAHKLLDELRIYQSGNKKTTHAPFLAYLETQRQGQIPATFSEAGKELLRKIAGPTTAKSNTNGNYALPPYELVDWIDEHFKKKGCIKPDDPWEEHAVALAIQRGYDFEFIPIWDMVNHDNGKLNTDNNAIHSPEGLKVWAVHDISAGEEIYATYNFCTDCKDHIFENEYVGDEWGTPGIYRDFGFVEPSTQLWVFMDYNIYFEIERDEETGEWEAYFDEDEEGNIRYGKPDEAGLRFLREQLERLEAMEELEELQEPGSIPKHEWDSIIQFYHNYVFAIEAAVEETEELNQEMNDELSSASCNNDTAFTGNPLQTPDTSTGQEASEECSV